MEVLNEMKRLCPNTAHGGGISLDLHLLNQASWASANQGATLRRAVTTDALRDEGITGRAVTGELVNDVGSWPL